MTTFDNPEDRRLPKEFIQLLMIARQNPMMIANSIQKQIMVLALLICNDDESPKDLLREMSETFPEHEWAEFKKVADATMEDIENIMGTALDQFTALIEERAEPDDNPLTEEEVESFDVNKFLDEINGGSSDLSS